MKKSHLPRFAGAWNTWIEVTSPGPFYNGYQIHYVNKKGQHVFARVKDEVKDIKHLVMTKTEFKKMFGHILNNKEHMSFVNNFNKNMKHKLKEIS